jgi:hypothetical protein
MPGNPTRHQAKPGIPIKVLTFFSHGLASTFRFDMDGPGDAACSLGLKDVASIDPTSFLPSVTVVAYSCRIGNSSTNEFEQAADWRAEAKPENSLAQKLAELLKVVVHAYVSRTEYKDTWNQGSSPVAKLNQNFADPFAHNSHFWSNDNTTHALWNDEGAHLPVVGSTSPHYLNPGGLGRFQFSTGTTPGPDGHP